MSGSVVLVTAIGRAAGSKAAAAALVCAGSEPGRPGLLIDVGGTPPRPALVASSGARELEERLARHLPEVRVASRGQTCHLAVAAEASSFDRVRAALPLVRDAVVAMHVPSGLARIALASPGLDFRAVLLRGDPAADRSLIALAVANLGSGDLSVRVLKRPLPWISQRRALFGVLPAGSAGGLPLRPLKGLLDVSSKGLRD